MQLLKKHGVLMEGSSPAVGEAGHARARVRMRTDRRRPSPTRWLCGSLFFTEGVGGTEACPLQRTHRRQ